MKEEEERKEKTERERERERERDWIKNSFQVLSVRLMCRQLKF